MVNAMCQLDKHHFCLNADADSIPPLSEHQENSPIGNDSAPGKAATIFLHTLKSGSPETRGIKHSMHTPRMFKVS